MADDRLILAFRKRQDFLVAHFRTSHLNDYHQNDRLRQELSAAIHNRKFDCLILDGEGLLYVISEVFGILTMTHNELQAMGRRMALCRLEPEVLELFRINHLDKVLQLYETIEEAFAEETKKSKKPEAPEK